jgi:hypothetical protein
MGAMTEAPSRSVCKLVIGCGLRAFGSVTMIGSVHQDDGIPVHIG